MKYSFLLFTALLFIGSTYAQTTVTIANQTWMLKNLDVSTYRNGDLIPQVTNDAEWAALTTGAYCYYNNDSAKYAAIYGKLYNWYAVNDSRGLAPTGWHVPSDEEWTLLSTGLGGNVEAGGKIKETGTTHWTTPNTGATNSSGFTGLPGGLRDYDGSFLSVGKDGKWWSSTEADTTSTWARFQLYYLPYFSRSSFGRLNGFSVRCLRD